ncbi:MAG: putative cystathionine beta-synthase [Myxococcota bacterium]|nr:putative cystathionine beta-synthase [Myxococcota bacterium]
MHDTGATENVLKLIGRTPIVEVKSFDTGLCRLFIKLESQNPGGSIKDRIGLSMIEAAEREGKIGPGSTLIEATAGNTGLALTLVARQKGYRIILVIPDKMSQEKVFHLKALGAEVIWTRSDVGKGHPDYYQDLAEKIAASTPKSFYVNQFNNPANPLAHYLTTGPEILEQMGGRVDAVVCGVGSGGTITGLSRFFAEKSPSTEMVLADPVGSILADWVNTGRHGEAGSWVVEGIGEDFIPPISDLSRVKKGYYVSDAESLRTARQLLRGDGVLAGSSSGTLLAAAIKYCKEQTDPKRVVTFACDSGNKYLSKMFNDFWMQDQGFLERETHGDLRDLISRRHDQRSVACVAPGDTLMRSYNLMKMNDVSQLPVMENDRIIGIIDESDVLLAVSNDEALFRSPVRDFMSRNLLTLKPGDSMKELTKVLNAGMVAIVCDGPQFLGLVTRIDLLNHLRRSVR